MGVIMVDHTQTVESKSTLRGYPIFVMGLCACFLFYKYVLQIYPSVITDELMRDFQLTGAGLGNLAATFYYAFMVAQLFVGVLLDKFSARWLTASAIFSCSLGVFLFSQTSSLLEAELSRALMGIGVAFATVAYMKLAAAWYSPRQYAFVGGLLATAAMAGAVFGEAPLALFIHSFGWRYCLAIVGFSGFVLAALFALVVRDAPPSLRHERVVSSTPVSLKESLQVFASKQNWLLTFYSGLAFSPIAVFGGLWGNPFLQQAYNLNKSQSAFLVSLVFIGLGIGSPLLGILSDRLQERRKVMMYSTLCSAVAISLVLYWQTIPITLLAVFLFIFGFALGAFMLVFTIGKELNSLRLTATVVAMINMSDAVLDAITEPAIGKLLDINWDGKIVNGVHYFSLHSYHIALGVLPIYLIIAALLLVWVKQK